MERQRIDNGTWFDLDAATKYVEGRWHDGQNFVSRSTGSQWHHEWLFRTAKGTWVLNEFSDYQGSVESWNVISDDEARAWFVKNELFDEAEQEGFNLSDLEA